jgi:hypothetical protein
MGIATLRSLMKKAHPIRPPANPKAKAFHSRYPEAQKNKRKRKRGQAMRNPKDSQK